MSAFVLNIRGQLNNIRLAESKALWPLFEAVVNSIQAIEDSPNKNNGKIYILAQREMNYYEKLLSDKEVLEKFESFTITDNGIGLDEENYKSFNTAYSTLKAKKGCKGIGRFLWLKAFKEVDIQSNYFEENSFYTRSFKFSPDGIIPEDNVTASNNHQLSTTITLKDFLPPYKQSCPVELDVIAKKLIEHCLLFFVSDTCPQIILSDGITETINLNDYFKNNIKDSLHQDHFTLKENEFVLYHLRLPEGASSHELHLCANMQEVLSVDLKKQIPDLQKKIIPKDDPIGFYYVGYLTSAYLDSIVNTTRTGFDFDEIGNQLSIWGTGKDNLISTAVEYVTGYLSDYLSDIEKQKRKQIDTFVSQDKPTYRYLLNNRPEVYQAIPAGLKADDLDMELHKHVQLWEKDIKKQGKELEKAMTDNNSKTDISYQELFEKYWSGVTEISKTCLAEYVTRRKTLLKMLEDALSIQKDGSFKKEDVIHSLICPMRHTSDDVTFEEMNLWIVDERLAYHKYLASDKTLKSIPIIESNSTKEPDIAIFDQAFAYSDSEEPFSTVTIVEFKKPDNDNKNPVNQVGEYVDLIRQGKKTKANGQSFSITDGTVFRCYVICDLTDKMRIHCLNSGLVPTPDNLGFVGFNQYRHSYIEVISYNKLLADAKKRNEILFDKLFAPKISEVIHLPS